MTPRQCAVRSEGAELLIDSLANKHVRAVHRIDSQVYPKPWSITLLRQEIDLADRFHIVALDTGSVVGHAGLMSVVDQGHITTVAVAPKSQGSGIASALMLVLVDRARALRHRSLTLEVRVSNDRAIDLYRRFGFVPAGIRKSYYADTGEDGLVMWAGDIDEVQYDSRLDQLRVDSPHLRFTPALDRSMT